MLTELDSTSRGSKNIHIALHWDKPSITCTASNLHTTVYSTDHMKPVSTMGMEDPHIPSSAASSHMWSVYVNTYT